MSPLDLRLPNVRLVWAGLGALVLGGLLLVLFPSSEIEIFSGGAARITAIITGVPTFRVEQGWMLPTGSASYVVVSPACRASHYFLMISALLAGRVARRGPSLIIAILLGLIVGLPLTLLINALRIVSVVQVYRWIVPHVPARSVPFLHTLAGVAVFLPCLIALNFFLEKYGNVFCLQPKRATG